MVPTCVLLAVCPRVWRGKIRRSLGRIAHHCLAELSGCYPDPELRVSNHDVGLISYKRAGAKIANINNKFINVEAVSGYINEVEF